MNAQFPRQRLGRIVVAVAAITTSAVLALAGCTGSGTSPSAEAKKTTLTIAMNSAPLTVDPSQLGGALAPYLLVAYQSLLAGAGVGKDPTPSLAESYEWLGDGPPLTLQMKLRDGVKFSDGAVLDSAAVKKSIEFFAKAGGSQAYVAAPIASMDTPDPLTIVFNLSRPAPTFLNDLAEGTGMGMIISPTALAGDPKALATSTEGAGPYVLTKEGTVEGSEYHYVPNEYYYDPEGVRYSDVVIKVIADPNTALASLQAGQVDVSYGYADTYARAESAGVDAAVFNVAVNGLWLMDWEGTAVPALADVRVRQAINYAVDRAAISKVDSVGLGVATTQLPAPDSLGFDSALNDTYPFDVAKAKSLLEEAGYADGFTLPVVVPGFVPTAPILAQAVAAQLAKVGITMEITKASTFPEYGTEQHSGKYGATVYPLPFGAGMPQAMGLMYYPQALINPQQTSLSDLLGAAGEASATVGDAAQLGWAATNKIAVEQAYSVPITTEPQIWYYAKTVSSVGPSALLNPVNITPAS